MQPLVLDTQLTPKTDDTLNQLAWAIESGQGQFEPIFARCDSLSRRDRLIQQLHQITSVSLQEIVLPPNSDHPYSIISQQLVINPPQALMILGFDRLQQPLVVLESLNQMREMFRQRFPCPVIFWLNGTLQKQLIRHAQDFESWGITLDFDSRT